MGDGDQEIKGGGKRRGWRGGVGKGQSQTETETDRDRVTETVRGSQSVTERLTEGER